MVVAGAAVVVVVVGTVAAVEVVAATVLAGAAVVLAGAVDAGVVFDRASVVTVVLEAEPPHPAASTLSKATRITSLETWPDPVLEHSTRAILLLRRDNLLLSLTDRSGFGRLGDGELRLVPHWNADL